MRSNWRGMIIFLVSAAVLAASHGLSAGLRIGVSLLTQEHQFYRDLQAGLQDQAKKSDYKLMINYGEYDYQKQAGQVDDFIKQKVDALLIAACDSKKIGESIVKANEAGIPVFTVDIANTGKGKVVSHIASDNTDGGRQAGRLMAMALKNKGKVVIINHPNITSVIERVNAFKEYLRSYPGIQIIADIPAWGQRDRAQAIMEDLLLMMPELNGVFAINDDSALGALRAVEAAGMVGKIVIVGYDATPEGRRAIENGKIYGDVIQYPDEIGHLAIQTIQDYLEGRKVPSVIPVKVGTFTGNH